MAPLDKTDRKPDQQPSQTNSNGLVEYIRSIGLFSRNARLYLLGSLLIGVNFQMFQLLLNLYLKELSFAEGQIGMINSGRALGMTIMAIPAALLIARIRLKPVLLGAAAFFALFSYGLASSDHMPLLIIYALFSGTCFAFFRVATGPFFMRNSTPVERTHLFSSSFAMMLLAGMIGALGAGKLVTLLTAYSGDIVSGYRYTLYIAIAVSFLALIPFSLIRSARPSADERRIHLDLPTLKRRGGFYIKISMANFLVGTGAGLIIPFLNLYFRDRFDVPPDKISYYYFLMQLAMVVGTLCGPLLSRRLGLVRAIVWTQFASLPFMLILAYTHSLPLAVFAFVARSGTMNIGVPLGTNFAMEICEKQEQGFVNALLMVSWTGSWMVSAAAGGFLIEKYGYTLTLNIAAGMYLLSIFIYFLFFRHSEQRHEESGKWIVPQTYDNK